MGGALLVLAALALAALLPLALCLAISVQAFVRLAMRAWRDSHAARRTCDGPGERAERLLRSLLDEHEYRQLMKRGYLDVASPSDAHRFYRIPLFIGRVRVYERGRAVLDLCVQPVEPLPSADVVAMHKLMIQGNEQEYLACANHFPHSSCFPRLPTLP